MASVSLSAASKLRVSLALTTFLFRRRQTGRWRDFVVFLEVVHAQDDFADLSLFPLFSAQLWVRPSRFPGIRRQRLS